MSSQEHLLRVARECTGASLRRAARAISGLYDARLAETGLRGTQFSLLVAIALAGEPPVTMLAERLGLDCTTMTRNLAPLERDGLVEDAAAGRSARALGQAHGEGAASAGARAAAVGRGAGGGVARARRATPA